MHRPLLILALLAAMAMVIAFSTSDANAASTRCAEDDVCWNWHTMGDHHRGVVTMNGTPKVVDCAHLRALVRQRNLDPRTPWLRGDWTCGRRTHVRLLNTR